MKSVDTDPATGGASLNQATGQTQADSQTGEQAAAPERTASRKKAADGTAGNTAGGAGPTPVNHIRWILDLYREKKWLVAGLFMLTLLSSAVAVTYPYLTKYLLDTIQRLLETPETAEPMRQVDRVLMIILAVGLGGLVASLFPGVRGATNSVFEHTIRTRYFGKILSKDHRFFASFPSGDIVTRLTDDLYDFPKLAWFLCSGIFRAVESISKVLFCLVAMLMLDWKLTLYSLIPLPLMIGLFYLTQDRIYDTFQKNQQAVSAINTRLEMSFSGVRIIKAYACEEKYTRFFSNVLGTRWNTEMAVAKLEIVLHLIYQYIDYVAQTGIVFAGGLMAVRGDISVGTFYAFYTYLSMLIYPILDIPQLFVSGKRAFVNMDRLEEMATFPTPTPSAVPARVDSIRNMTLEHAGFSYGDRDSQALRDINLTIHAGDRIGVIGPVGAGKSTLIKMLLGLLPPVSGSVRVNGTPLAEVDMTSYRSRLGYVPQEPLLFSGSIRENVGFGVNGDIPSVAAAAPEVALPARPPAGEKAADTAAPAERPVPQTGGVFGTAVDAAQLTDELSSFSEGAETVVGQRGVSLSGGQKQRVAIARAIARAPSVMLLDDITASLDAANEERLMRRLDQMDPSLTYVIVSHRLSTLQYVDKVLYLENGEVRGFGSHDELLALPWYRAFIDEHMGDGGTRTDGQAILS